MFVILHVVTKWKHYLQGRHFKIRTDHINLKYLLDQKVTYLFQNLWLTKLQGFDYEIKYRRGKENIVIDALSRVSSGEICIMVVSTLTTNIMEEVKGTWEKDVAVQTIIQDLIRNLASHPNYKQVNGHLNRKGKIVVGNDPMLYNKLIALYHNSIIEGHSRATMTTKRVQNVFYQNKQQRHMMQFVRECHICQRNKIENVLTPGLLQLLLIP